MKVSNHWYRQIIQSLHELGYNDTWRELGRAKWDGVITQEEYELIASVWNTKGVENASSIVD